MQYYSCMHTLVCIEQTAKKDILLVQHIAMTHSVILQIFYAWILHAEEAMHVHMYA